MGRGRGTRMRAAFAAPVYGSQMVDRGGDPFSKAELVEALRAGALRAGEVWSRFAPEVFFAPIGEAWSPADNVRHLIKSNRPLERALRIAKALLLLRFGPSLRGSMRIDGVVSRYREALGGGLTAGRFSPKPLDAPPTIETAAMVVAELAASLDGVADALGSWREWQLERLRLPHPGMGLLTVREMVLFTIYHQQHHEGTVVRRLGEIDGASGSGGGAGRRLAGSLSRDGRPDGRPAEAGE